MFRNKQNFSKFSLLRFSAANVTRNDGRFSGAKMCQWVKCFDTNSCNASFYYLATPDRTEVCGYSVAASVLKTAHIRHFDASCTACFFLLFFSPRKSWFHWRSPAIFQAVSVQSVCYSFRMLWPGRTLKWRIFNLFLHVLIGILNNIKY